jgi:hypothetical protein
MIIKQGSVVLVDFSYSNLKEGKIEEIRQQILELIS